MDICEILNRNMFQKLTNLKSFALFGRLFSILFYLIIVIVFGYFVWLALLQLLAQILNKSKFDLTIFRTIIHEKFIFQINAYVIPDQKHIKHYSTLYLQQ